MLLYRQRRAPRLIDAERPNKALSAVNGHLLASGDSAGHIFVWDALQARVIVSLGGMNWHHNILLQYLYQFNSQLSN